MKQFFINLWLILSIVVQSYAAVADSAIDLDIAFTHLQQQHVHDVEHHGKHHDVNKVASLVFSDTAKAASASHDHSDCHHCGHCTTPLVIWQISDLLTEVIDLDDNHFSLYKHNVKDVIDNTFRPPII